MIINVTADDIKDVFPRALLPEEEARLVGLLQQAMDLINLEFMRRGLDLESELLAKPWLELAIKQAMRIMISRALLIGESTGVASVSSTTGPQSDTVTYSQGVEIHWGGVGLDDYILDLLGLGGGGLPRGYGGVLRPYGGRSGACGAEFSERERRC